MESSPTEEELLAMSHKERAEHELDVARAVSEENVDDPQLPARFYTGTGFRLEKKLRAALASDSQGGETVRCICCEQDVPKAEAQYVDLPDPPESTDQTYYSCAPGFGCRQLEQGEDSGLPVQRYVPAHLASAPPEDSGENDALRDARETFRQIDLLIDQGTRGFTTGQRYWLEKIREEIYAFTRRTIAPSSPEPQAQEGEGIQRLALCVLRNDGESSRAMTTPHPEGKYALFSEHEDTVERLKKERDDFQRQLLDAVRQRESFKRYRDMLGDNCESLRRRANDLQARLEKVEAIAAECYRLTGSDPDGDPDSMLAQHAVQAVRELREENERVGEWEDRAIRAETALDDAAAEFERRADEAEATWQANKDEPWHRATMRAHRGDAQLLREKQAALKGGTDGN